MDVIDSIFTCKCRQTRAEAKVIFNNYVRAPTSISRHPSTFADDETASVKVTNELLMK